MTHYGSANFHPSVIEDAIYDILDNEDFIVSSESYTLEAMSTVLSYMDGIQETWVGHSTTEVHCGDTVETLALSWIEDGHIHQLVLVFEDN